MHISKIKIENYKSFRSSDDLNLKPGFNVIVGQNNAGKTALVEALSLDFSNIPHLSVVTRPTANAPVLSLSTVTAWVNLSRGELIEVLRGGSGDFSIPNVGGDRKKQVQSFLNHILDETIVTCSFTGNQKEAHIRSYNPGNADNSLVVRYNREKQEFEPTNIQGGNPNLYDKLAAVANRIYLFKAERFTQPKFPIGPKAVLKSDASNLAEVLMNLQTRNPSKFDRYIKSVQHVLPEVRSVSTHVMGENEVEIRIWMIDTHTERQDLTVPLANSGTGIGQVLAILYVVITADHARTIIIDEPQSFLHPGAVRKLIEILKEHRHHQYIITTHSPTVISAVDPDTLTIVRIKDGESFFESVSVEQTDKLRTVLREVGARLSDVFGADSILWVEGLTEEEAFRALVERKVVKSPLMGTEILAVKHTGDFEGKRRLSAELIFDIYKKLSKGSGLLPPAVGFIFDRDRRTDTKIEDLERKSKDPSGKPTVAFTRRRMLENYLLHPVAIAAVISEDLDSGITGDQVKEWLDKNKWNEKYFHKNVEQTDEWWINNVHGGSLLIDLFQDLSGETPVVFHKTDHSVRLTKWIAQNAPEELREIAGLIEQALDRQHLATDD